MEFDFSHLAGNQIETRDYEFVDLGGVPTLECRPATTQNKAYQNAVQRVTRGRSVDQGREADKKLAQIIAAHVVKGWRNVTNKTGEAIPFSAKACAEFLMAIPDFMFVEFVRFVTEPRNFYEDALTTDEIEEMAGN